MKNIFLYSILSGLFIGTSYIPFPPWAILFGLTPLIVATIYQCQEGKENIKQALRRAFFLGWLTQFILNLIGFHWIATTAIEFGHFPQWAGIIVLIGFAAIGHLYYAIAPLMTVQLSHILKRRIPQMSEQKILLIEVGIFLSSFLFIEALWPSIFPWHLGYPWLWASFPGAQAADLIGFEGLNMLTVLINGFFAVGWLSWQSNKKSVLTRLKPTFPWVALGLSLFFVTNLVGFGREKPWQDTNAVFSVLIVQGNIGNYEKLIAERQRDYSLPIIKDYVETSLQKLTETAEPPVSYILWPETAYPDYFDSGFGKIQNTSTIKEFVTKSHTTLLTGTYSYSPEQRQTFNSFIAIGPNGSLIDSYHKSILIPFGEKFPFSDIIPYTKWLFPGLGSFGQGDGPKVMSLPELKIGPQICLESLYPKFSAAMARSGAEVFSNVTNDSWFGKTFEPHQHMIMTIARAVENRRPLLRSTNTGITTVALASGQVLEQSPIAEKWAGIYRVPYKKAPPVTLYSKISGYSGWLAGCLLLCLIFTPTFFCRASKQN